MKELSIEEKAKRYDEAIEIAKSLYDYNQPISASNVIINNIFPQLKESRDERIRKELIDFILYMRDKTNITEVQKAKSYYWIAWLEKQVEQKPEWSEEDKSYLNVIIEDLKELYKKRKAGAGSVLGKSQKDNIDWLKSLKDRVQSQHKQEWSEEDEKIISRLHNIIFDCLTFEKFRVTEAEYSKLYDWLKSLKDKCVPQPHWKPSEEQMKSLAWVVEYGNTCQTAKLKEILEQLKAL